LSFWQVIVLSIVQELAELLPVSSSAHVVVAEKLMGLDPASPAMTLLLVMLHTGTMIAVIVYFWRQWREARFQRLWVRIVFASAITGVVGEILIKAIEKVTRADAEPLFGRLDLIAPALAVVGVLILVAGVRDRGSGDDVGWGQTPLIGAVQGPCLPFCGFSRSGATISTGMLAGVSRARAEAFSFALAVVLTPPALGREVLRLTKSSHGSLAPMLLPCLLGAVFALLAATAAAILHHCGY
jgi:undecaprenyl-diphosphatase